MEIVIKNELIETDYYVKPIGRIDATNAVEFGTTINDAIYDNEIKNLTLDFIEVPYISSMGLRALLELQRHMNEVGKMKLINVSKDVNDVFNMTGFNKILTIENVIE